MSKQAKQAKVVDNEKEKSKIEDRPLIMAPDASIQAGLKFFRDKCAAEDQAIRDGFKPLAILEARELLEALHAACRVTTSPQHTQALIAGQKLLGRYNIK